MRKALDNLESTQRFRIPIEADGALASRTLVSAANQTVREISVRGFVVIDRYSDVVLKVNDELGRGQNVFKSARDVFSRKSVTPIQRPRKLAENDMVDKEHVAFRQSAFNAIVRDAGLLCVITDQVTQQNIRIKTEHGASLPRILECRDSSPQR
ncbi:MAG: hypothetical protein ACREV9_17655 [Burkholderiales bacterium]